jgi:hypothetical protein
MPSNEMASRLNKSRSALISRAPFGHPDRFPVIFLSCKVNVGVYDAKSGHGHNSPHSQARRLHLSACKTSFLRLRQSGLRTQTANQAKFISPKNSVLPPRR